MRFVLIVLALCFLVLGMIFAFQNTSIFATSYFFLKTFTKTLFIPFLIMFFCGMGCGLFAGMALKSKDEYTDDDY